MCRHYCNDCKSHDPNIYLVRKFIVECEVILIMECVPQIHYSRFASVSPPEIDHSIDKNELWLIKQSFLWGVHHSRARCLWQQALLCDLLWCWTMLRHPRFHYLFLYQCGVGNWTSQGVVHSKIYCTKVAQWFLSMSRHLVVTRFKNCSFMGWNCYKYLWCANHKYAHCIPISNT